MHRSPPNRAIVRRRARRQRSVGDVGTFTPESSSRQPQPREAAMRILCLGLLLFAATACTRNTGGASSDGGVDMSGSAAGGLAVIKHIVIIMQENRWFDHYFGTFPAPKASRWTRAAVRP